MKEVNYEDEDPHWAVVPMKKKKKKGTGERPLGRLRRRWEDICKMYLKEIGANAIRLIGSNLVKLRWGGRVAKMEEGKSAFKILTCLPT